MEKIILETPTSPGENDDIKQITLRKYSENDYNFVYEVKKNAYKKYVEECWGNWDENAQREYFKKFIDDYCDNSYIIQYDGNDIGFYNDEILEDGSYEIGNICIIPEYQGKGIGTQVLENMIQAHENQDIHIQYFKQNPVGNLYKKLGFEHAGETDYHFQMVKKLKNSSDFKFRKITKNEFEKLKNLFPDDDEMWLKYREKRLNQFDANDIDIFVIEYNGIFIGEISVNYSSHTLLSETIPNQRVYLEAFRLDENYRGSGLGQSLVQYTLAVLEKQGYSEFTIGVEDDNEVAKHIYFKLGFNEAIDKGFGNEFDPCEYTLYLKDTKKINKVARK